MKNEQKSCYNILCAGLQTSTFFIHILTVYIFFVRVVQYQPYQYTKNINKILYIPFYVMYIEIDMMINNKIPIFLCIIYTSHLLQLAQVQYQSLQFAL